MEMNKKGSKVFVTSCKGVNINIEAKNDDSLPIFLG
jgi:hypothetical protein